MSALRLFTFGSLASLACASVALGAATAAAPPAAKPAAHSAAATAIPANLPSLSAQQIAERNVAARGGLAAWEKVGAMTLAGKLDAGKERKDGGEIAVITNYQARALERAKMRKALEEGKTPVPEVAKVIQLPFQMDLKRPTLMRLEIPFQGETAIQVYDGKNGWKLRPFLGRHEVEPFSDEELKLAASQQELDGALINYQAKGTRVELDGTEMLEGHANYRLKLTMKGGAVRHLWVDGQTFLESRIEGAPRRWDGKVRTVYTWYRDYKSVDGLQVAHRLETQLSGVPGTENVYIEHVVLNPRLDSTRFSKPI